MDMSPIEIFYLQTPIGELQVFCCENNVLEVNLGLDVKKISHKDDLTGNELTERNLSINAKSVKNKFIQYFKNADSDIMIDVRVNGTDFQKSVWDAISSIEKGDTCTYSDIAEQLASSPRAVGNACRANPVPIVVPCHRVVAKSGLGGFAGKRKGTNIDSKTWLLNHEHAVIA